MILTGIELATMLRISQPDALQILRILSVRGLATRLKSTDTVQGGGKRPYRFEIQDQQLLLLKNLFRSDQPAREKETSP